MRRIGGPVLVGLGVFLIVAAALVRFYALPALTKVPAGYHSTTHLEATGAQVFNSDPEVLAAETHDLVITSETREDASADAPDGVVVWVNATTIDTDTGTFQLSTERVAFDESDGTGVDCDTCDTWIAESDGETVEQVPTVFEGQIYKFPFETEAKSYDVWDGPTGEAVEATYEGEESIEGTNVYKFVQVIEPTVIDTREVPGSVFGSEEASVQADMVYAMTRTFYIEPATGAPLNRVEERDQTLVYDGQSVPAFVGTVQYTDDQVTENVDEVALKSVLLAGSRVLFPVILVLLGLGLLGLGLVLNRRRRSNDVDGATHKDKPLVKA